MKELQNNQRAAIFTHKGIQLLPNTRIFINSVLNPGIQVQTGCKPQYSEKRERIHRNVLGISINVKRIIS